MNKPILLLAMLGMVLLAALPALAQTNVPILSPGNNLAGDTEDVCSALNQELLDLDLLGLSPESSDVVDSCNDILNVDDRDRETNDQDTIPTQEIGQEVESGDTSTASDMSIAGDNNLVCDAGYQSGTTGNSPNAQGIQPTQAGFDEAELNGIASEVAPDHSVDCAPSLGQSSAAG